MANKKLINCDQLQTAVEKVKDYVDTKDATKANSSHVHGNIANGGTLSGKSAVVVTDSNGLITSSSITTTELNSLDNITSNVQTQLDGKANSNHVHGNLTNAGALGTANAVAITDGNKLLTASTSITTTELGYLDGVTSNIQTQLGNKASSSHTHGNITNNGQLGTASAVVVTDENKNIIASSAISTTELGYLDGVTSNVQTQLNNKAASSHTHGNITNGGALGTANAVVITDGNKLVTASTTITTTELGYLDGVTSSVQTQINSKAPTSHASTGTGYGVSDATNYGHAMASSTTPKVAGTAAVGSETAKFARGDHVHPAQTSVTGSSGSCTGNAATASKWQTARKLSWTGDASGEMTVDGSADKEATLTLAASGVTAGSYGPSANASPAHAGTFSVPYVTVDAKGRVTAASTKTITLPGDNDYRVKNELATTTKAYVTGTTSATTATGTQVFDTGVYLDTTAGKLVATTFAGALSGNASTATTLATARNFYVTDNDATNTGPATSFNGSTNVTIKLPATIKASLSGNASTATKLAASKTINGTAFDGSSNITTSSWGTARTITIGSTGKSVNGSENVTWSLSEIGAAASGHTHNYAGSSSVGGSATSAVKLDTARTITISGLLSGSASFDGSSNITITTANAKPAKSGDWWSGGVAIINTDGVMEVGKYLDFHNTDASTNDFDVRLQATTNGPITISLPSAEGTLARTSDNVASATKLQTARTINGTSFDGSANITTANWGTTRTLTIGNKGQSVNGGGNVSWTLSDIGAFPSAGGSITGNVNLNNGVSLNWKTSAAYTNTSTNETVAAGTNISMLMYNSAGNLHINAGAYDKYIATGETFINSGSNIALRTRNNGSVTIQPNGSTTVTFGKDNNVFTKQIIANGGIRPDNAIEDTCGASDKPWSSVYADHYQLYGEASKQYGYFGAVTTGTTSTTGESRLMLGNSTATGSASNSYGRIQLYGTNTGYTMITPGNNSTSNITLTLPSSGGTLARTDDNVASATKLQTARNITIGNKTNSFDGSGAITFTLSDIGAAAASHGTHLSLGTTSSTAYRGDYGNTAYTHSQAAHAPSNAQKNSDITKAEIEAKLTGAITSHTHSYASTTHTHSDYASSSHTHSGYASSSHTHNYAGSSSAGGAATSANKLATSRTLTIGGTGKSFDGSGNVSWTLSEILSGTGSISLAGGASTYCDGTFYTCDYLRLSDKLIAAPANNDNRFFQFLDSGGSAVGGYFATIKVKDNYIMFGSNNLYMQASAPSWPATGDVWIDI